MIRSEILSWINTHQELALLIAFCVMVIIFRIMLYGRHIERSRYATSSFTPNRETVPDLPFVSDDEAEVEGEVEQEDAQSCPYPEGANWVIYLPDATDYERMYFSSARPVVSSYGNTITFVDISDGMEVTVRFAKVAAFELPTDGSEKYEYYDGFDDDETIPGTWIIETLCPETKFGDIWRTDTQPVYSPHELAFVDNVDGLEVILVMPAEVYADAERV